ncbi:MAG: auxin-regulated protein [Candidatus Dadabacteria bacterium]|nr:MAG: auxin-regulated protein [Candidatus Dadabacteria bacterium]
MLFFTTKLLYLYAKHRFKKLSSLEPVTAQEKQLFKLLLKGENTVFGKEHSFSKIKSVSDYQQSVPLRYYEDFWRDYWQKSYPFLDGVTWHSKYPYYALSSGTTTGTTKYIPCSKEMLESNKKAGMDTLIFHLANYPRSKILNGKNLILGGSTDLRTLQNGSLAGDLSAIAYKEMPFWIKPFVLPPKEIAFLSNWEEKIEKIARLVLKSKVTSISGVPSWMLLFFEKVKELGGDKEVKELMPHLELFIHGGISFKPYRAKFKNLLQGLNIDYREVYPASEGFIAVSDTKNSEEGLRLIVDHGIFYEFVPLEELSSKNPTRHWVKDIELNVNYAVVLTTCAGLWSYILGDTVKFVSKDPLRLLITGRTSYMLSAFGEHLIAEEIEEAVAKVCEKLSLTVNDFCVFPFFPENEESKGYHCYIVEFDKKPAAGIVKQFSQEIDKYLCLRNEDYQAHRAEDFGMKAPVVIAVEKNFFKDWMKKRGKLGGQNKVLRIVTDEKIIKSLRYEAKDKFLST